MDFFFSEPSEMNLPWVACARWCNGTSPASTRSRRV